MPLGLPNRIVDNSDSKPSKFKHRYWSDLKSDNKIVSYRSLFDQILMERSKMLTLKSIKVNLKIEKVEFNQKVDIHRLFQLNLIIIDHFRSLFKNFN